MKDEQNSLESYSVPIDLPFYSFFPFMYGTLEL